MERVSHRDVVARAESVSARLRGDLRVVPQRRNGYTGLDLYDGAGCVDTLATGTARTILLYLSAMSRTLDITGR